MNEKILVIDDEEALCEILKFNLEKDGYDVTTAHSAEEALDMDLTPYHLFIVDIMMEKLSGFDFAKRVRNMPAVMLTPIIFCTALTGEDETVMGLNMGADDYITKPFVVSEVLARVRAVLRRSRITREALAGGMTQPQPKTQVEAPKPKTTKDQDVTFRGLTIHTASKTVTLDGEPINLTKTEYSLLYFFLTHPDHVYSRKEIIEEVWSVDVVVTSRTIDTNITRLRKKIGEYGKHIFTRLGFGYGFNTAE